MTDRRTLVLFDFDGTLTTRDTLFAFTRFAKGYFSFGIGLVVMAFPMVLHKCGFISAHLVKEMFLEYFFGGMNSKLFNKLGERFASNILPGLIRPLALDAIRNYQHAGSKMIIVSASVSEWILPWAKEYGMDVIATKLQVVNGKITGRIDGLNCNGEEKVRRIADFVDLNEYPVIVAYGDTKGDLPMLALANQKFFKPFRNRK